MGQFCKETLAVLEKWALEWQMSFNVAKCAVLRSGGEIFHHYTLNGLTIKNVDSHPYIGVELSYNLSLKGHVSSLISKALRTTAILR